MKKLLTLLMTLGTLTAFAQMPVMVPDSATLTFIMQANQAGMTEINASQLAISRTKNADIKAFAEMMITDHTKANDRLNRIIVSKGWQISPPAPADVAPDTVLVTSAGTRFDKYYVTMMLADHKKAVMLFKYASLNLTQPEVKAFAVRTLPVLREHLASIQAIASQMGIKPNNQL